MNDVNAPAAKGVALVVDDSETNRTILEALLSHEGYRVVLAEDGVQAVQCYIEHSPDIIFMDVMMPRMDGYEATRRIKALAGTQFVPIIFLTALTADEAMLKCIDAGGDGFLSKPYKQAAFRAKIIAMERIRDLTRTNEAQHRKLDEQRLNLLREQEVAEHIYNAAVTADNVGQDYVRSLLRPVSTFSGDMLLSAYHPAGKLHVLLGDFTGHGLTASIGALPAADVFRAMTAKGYSAPEILASINRKLHHLLPPNMFMACCMVVVEDDLKTISVWNAAMPDMLLIDGSNQQIKRRVASAHLPLGIVADTDYQQSAVRLNIAPGDRILLCSDGLTEARNAAQESFGEARYVQAACASANSFDAIVAALDAFRANEALTDDLSLVEINYKHDLQYELLKTMHIEPRHKVLMPATERTTDGWRWRLDLTGSSLRQVNPVPLAMSQLLEIQGETSHQQSLFVILTELYSNALEHGLLQMDSKLKATEDGFSQYYIEREAKLAQLVDGYICFEIEHIPRSEDDVLVLRIQDSGTGFDHEHWTPKQETDVFGLCGRGIMLVHNLCESMRFLGNGSQVEAVYVWEKNAGQKK